MERLNIYYLKSKIIFLSLLASIYVLAWLIQDKLFLNWDVSYALHASKALLAGGTYADDFFDINPPLIYYLYAVPVLFSQFFSISLVIALRIYVFLLCSCSLGLCYFLIKRIFLKENALLAKVFFISLAMVFLILPFYELGQRDHLMLILTMPYLLLVVQRLKGDVFLKISFLQIPPKLPFSQRRTLFAAYIFPFLIAVFAALGFAIKPYFLLTPVLIELYYMVHRKNMWASLRIETLTLIVLLLSYLLLVYVFFPYYVQVIIPLTARVFYAAYYAPWGSVFNTLFLFCCLPMVCCFLLQVQQYRTLYSILCLSLIGFLFSYAAQRSAAYYHILPAFSISLLLLTLLFAQWLSTRENRHYFRMGLVGALFCIFLLYKESSVWVFIISPAWVLIFLVLCLLLSLRKNGPRQVFILIVAMLIFALPVFQMRYIYNWGMSYKQLTLNKFIDFMRKHTADKSVYFLSTWTNYAFPAVDYVSAIPVQRLSCVYMAGGLLNPPPHPRNLNQQRQHRLDETFFNNLIIDDLHNKRPQFVFIDVRERKPTILDNHFDFLRYFSLNPRFRAEWKAYSYFGRIEEPSLYKFMVYKRD